MNNPDPERVHITVTHNDNVILDTRRKVDTLLDIPMVLRELAAQIETELAS